MAQSIYTRDLKGGLEPLQEEPFSTEDELQELIAEHPELLDGEQIRPDEPRRWILVTREKGIAESAGASARWALDHLIVDQDARPTLVEVKRGKNPEIRRAVVGQLLEYAANAAVTWSAAELRASVLCQKCLHSRFSVIPVSGRHASSIRTASDPHCTPPGIVVCHGLPPGYGRLYHNRDLLVNHLRHMTLVSRRQPVCGALTQRESLRCCSRVRMSGIPMGSGTMLPRISSRIVFGCCSWRTTSLTNSNESCGSSMRRCTTSRYSPWKSSSIVANQARRSCRG